MSRTVFDAEWRWRKAEAFAARRSLGLRLRPHRGVSGERQPTDSRYFVLTSDFGSMGDQALAMGAVAAARSAGIVPHVLVPGPAAPWRDVGLENVSSLDEWRDGEVGFLTEAAREGLRDRDITVIGADCIDGHYNHGDIAFRVRLLNEAAANGRVAQMANFSISVRPTRMAISILKALSPVVELWARDSVSRRRAERLLGRPARACPDIGALLEPDLSGVAECLASFGNRTYCSDGKRVMCLVPNGHLVSLFGIRPDHLMAYWTKLAVTADREGWDVLLMPHDTREQLDDPGLCRRIVLAAAREGVDVGVFMPESAANAKGMLSSVDICIGARMHACVASLSSGTPTIGIDYLDKFEGQFEWYRGLGRKVDGLPLPEPARVVALTEQLTRGPLEWGIGPSPALRQAATAWLRAPR